MKLDGNAVLYLLSREFGDVSGSGLSHSRPVDYPMLYDESSDMGGHVVLVPPDAHPAASPYMRDTVCVCIDADSAKTAAEAGFPTVHVREAVTLQRLYNRMQALFVANERLDTQLRTYVDTYAGFQMLLDACAQHMGCTCALMDKRYRLVCEASGTPASSTTFLDDEAIDLFMASREYLMMRASRKVYVVPGTSDLLVKNIFSGDELVGMLAMAHDGTTPNARYVHFLLDYLARYVEAMYACLGSFGLSSLAARRINDMFGRALRGERIDIAALDRALAEEAGEENGQHVVLRFVRRFTHEDEADLGFISHRVELAWPFAHCAVADGSLFALVGIDEALRSTRVDFLQELTLFARDALVKVGVSRAFSSCARLAGARMQAEAALAQGDASDSTHWVYRFDDYALPWLLAHGKGDAAFEVIAHPAVAELVRYDSAHGTELLHTLRVFCDCRYNATEAAMQLFVARSTLLNRLERIETLVHVDLDSFEERVYLGMSFLMEERLGRERRDGSA